MSAVVHNLPDLAIPLKNSIMENLPDIKFDFDSFSLIPAKPAFPYTHPISIKFNKLFFTKIVITN